MKVRSGTKKFKSGEKDYNYYGKVNFFLGVELHEKLKKLCKKRKITMTELTVNLYNKELRKG